LLSDLPGDPIVVGYAPQLDLIRHSALTISHGGLNTVLESLAWGVPMVVLPVTYDQPGVGARVEWAGVGRSIPVARLTLERLRVAVRIVLGDPAYRARAGLLRSSIEAADGLNRAADLIESAFGTRRRDDVPPEVSQRAGAGSDRVHDRRLTGWRSLEVAPNHPLQQTAGACLLSGMCTPGCPRGC